MRHLYLNRREHHLLCHILTRGLEDGGLGSLATKALLARLQSAKEVDDPRGSTADDLLSADTHEVIEKEMLDPEPRGRPA